MVNYHDPATITQEYVALVKLWHVTNGIFVWEFFSTLHFEWDVFRGKRSRGWTIWAYSTARVFTLLAVILSMVGFDTTTPINCQAWATFLLLFSYISSVAASLLFLLRVIAVWNKENIVIVIAMGVLMTDIAFMVNATVRFRSTWSPEANTCLLGNFDSTSLKLSTGAILFTDVLSLSIMLTGLLRRRRETSGAFSLGRFLWNEDLIWILIATIAGVPTAVLLILDLNVPLNLMFQNPSMIVSAIAATRLYRSLANFFSSDIRHSSHVAQGSVRADVSTMRVRTGPISFNQMVVSVGDQFPASESSYVSTVEERYKALELNLKGVESGPEI